MSKHYMVAWTESQWHAKGGMHVQVSACKGYPSSSGSDTADAACQPGSTGPLCAVCKPAHFAFGGQCK